MREDYILKLNLISLAAASGDARDVVVRLLLEDDGALWVGLLDRSNT